MGVAGSLANVAVETCFHFADTVNIRAKASEKSISTMSLVSKIWAKEGLYGFSKGFSACLYGSAVCGLIYFSFYKAFKNLYREVFGEEASITICFLSASFLAELFTMSI